MKLFDLTEQKAKKDGIVTPQMIVDNLKESIDTGKIKNVMVLAVDEDDYIHSAWSTMGGLKRLGLLEYGKNIVLEDMEE